MIRRPKRRGVRQTPGCPPSHELDGFGPSPLATRFKSSRSPGGTGQFGPSSKGVAPERCVSPLRVRRTSLGRRAAAAPQPQSDQHTTHLQHETGQRTLERATPRMNPSPRKPDDTCDVGVLTDGTPFLRLDPGGESGSPPVHGEDSASANRPFTFEAGRRSWGERSTTMVGAGKASERRTGSSDRGGALGAASRSATGVPRERCQLEIAGMLARGAGSPESDAEYWCRRR